MMNVDFKMIRPIRNSANNGFEELCCQLAACEPVASGVRFVRNGTPDGGVEGYWELTDGTEHGWQAKYFDKLDGVQWQQLDESVETALRTHPSLSHYTVCLPIDLPDSREKSKKSLRQKWDERIAKWQTLATAKGMTVTFDLWGASELLRRLADERHSGRLWFWFGRTELSPDWFARHLDQVIKTAGPRYNAELNVELPIAICFDALGYTPAFRNRIAKIRRDYRKALNSCKTSLSSNSVNSEFEASRKVFEAAGDSLFTCLCRFGDGLPPAELSKEVIYAASQARDAASHMFSVLDQSAAPSTNLNVDVEDRARPRPNVERHDFNVDNFLTEIQRIEDFVELSSAELATRPAMLLTGNAGNGKTHLLCDVGRLRNTANLPTIVVLGQQLGKGELWMQIVERLGLHCTRDEFLGALEAVAESVGGRALVLLDAINEASEIDWQSELPAMLAVASHYPRIGIAVSCRTTYERQLVREDLVPLNLSRIEHDGFGSQIFTALAAFCRHYDIDTLNTPPLSQEFENPLFLKLFCQGLHNSGLRRPPKGHHGLQRIFSFLLESVNKKLHHRAELDYPENEPIVQRAANIISDAMLEAQRYVLPRSEAQSLLEVVLSRPNVGYSKSLLSKLIGEGILAEDLHWPDNGESPVPVVRFGYERLADYQFADRLINRHLVPETQSDAFSADGPLAKLFSGDRVNQLRGLLAATIVLVAERTGHELGELMPQLQASGAFADAFLEGLPWREARDVTPYAVKYVDGHLANCGPQSAVHSRIDAVINTALLLTAQPGHPLNARWLHAWLLPLAMPDRDLLWSMFLHRSRRRSSWQRPSVIERLLDWGWREDADETDPCAGFDDDVTELAATTLTWCLTTSNRYIRDRATKALVCVLLNRLHLIPSLLDNFKSVDDLYITERLLCAVYGAVTRSALREQVGAVAFTVYRRIFEDRKPPTHVLLRDYARGIVEYALVIGCSIDVDVSRIRPPYQSEPVQLDVPTWKELEAKYASADYGALLLSLAPNWGDFARYVLGTDSVGRGLHTWTNQPDPFGEWRRLNNDRPTLPEPIGARWHLLNVGNASSPFVGFANSDTTLGAAHQTPGAIATSNDDLERPNDLPNLSEQDAGQIAAFLATLSHEESQLLDRYQAACKACSEANDIALAEHKSQLLESDLPCRWILARVMELGWTPERFAAFDRELTRGDMRAAQKSERIGKKYQWLAYHELASRIFDHRPMHHDPWDGTQQYEGPWQAHLRDIDPTFLIKHVEPDRFDKQCWWLPLSNPLHEGTSLADPDWLLHDESIPDFTRLLSLQRASDGSRWFPLQLWGEWIDPEEVQEEYGRSFRRRLTFSLGAWLVPKAHAKAFVKAVRLKEWSGRDVTSMDYYEPFLGEFAWGASFKEHAIDAQRDLNGSPDWNNSQIRWFESADTGAACAVMRYLHEGRGFDCSLTESCSGYTPSVWLAKKMGLIWGRRGFTFTDQTGKVVAYDPSFESTGPTAFVVEQNALQQFIDSSKLAPIWLLIGEKLLIGDVRETHKELRRVSVFRQVFSLSTRGQPNAPSKTLGYLGESPTPY